MFETTGMVDEPVVIDASAMAALLFGEPRGGEVAETLQGKRLFAPTLLRYELGSVCVKKRELYPEMRDAFLSALGLLDRLGLREVAVEDRGVVELAERKRLTFYDASYLWLARELGVDLITLDTRLHRADQ